MMNTTLNNSKGFLRRVHRWPILLQRDLVAGSENGGDTQPASPIVVSNIGSPLVPSSNPHAPQNESRSFRDDSSSALTVAVSTTPDLLINSGISRRQSARSVMLTGDPSAFLDEIRNWTTHGQTVRTVGTSSSSERSLQGLMSYQMSTHSVHRPQRDIHPMAQVRSISPVDFPQTRPVIASYPSQGSTLTIQDFTNDIPPPVRLAALCDGEHHSDELGTRFNVSWADLEKWLQVIGNGSAGNLGRIEVIYR